MPNGNRGNAIGRRRFLKGATATGAILGTPSAAVAQSPQPVGAARSMPLPDTAAETMPPAPDPVQQTSSGANKKPGNADPVNLLSGKEVADIYAFLQALPGRRYVKNIPIRNNWKEHQRELERP